MLFRSQYSVAQRMRTWMDHVASESDGTIAVFTHGHAIRFLLAGYFGLDKRSAYKAPMENTSITRIKYENGVPTCIVQNDTKHLHSENSRDRSEKTLEQSIAA